MPNECKIVLQICVRYCWVHPSGALIGSYSNPFNARLSSGFIGIAPGGRKLTNRADQRPCSILAGLRTFENGGPRLHSIPSSV